MSQDAPGAATLAFANDLLATAGQLTARLGAGGAFWQVFDEAPDHEAAEPEIGRETLDRHAARALLHGRVAHGFDGILGFCCLEPDVPRLYVEAFDTRRDASVALSWQLKKTRFGRYRPAGPGTFHGVADPLTADSQAAAAETARERLAEATPPSDRAPRGPNWSAGTARHADQPPEAPETQRLTAEARRFCSSCGSALKVDASFCASCGARIVPTSTPRRRGQTLTLAAAAIAVLASLTVLLVTVLGGKSTGGTHRVTKNTPAAVSTRAGGIPHRDPTRTLAMGGNSACLLEDGGQVKCWGDNSYGGLGNGSALRERTCSGATGIPVPCSATPVPVRGIEHATAITNGGWVTCALLADRTIDCWGDNRLGGLGAGIADGPEICRAPSGDSPCSRTPVRVVGITNATAVAAHGPTVCALLADGTVECWGDNRDGGLGIGTFTGPQRCSIGACSTKPVKVPGIDHAVGIVAGCAVLSSGEVECWGDNSAGGLGNGDLTGPETCSQPGEDEMPCSTRPVRVQGITDATALAKGGGQICSLRRSGGIACWGYNAGGQLGNGITTGPQTCSSDQVCSTVPVEVVGIDDATAITAGGGFTCALRGRGRIACWGNNISGQLGDGTKATRATAADVPQISGAIAVAAGDASVCVRVPAGVECWGDNSAGELGDGTTTDRTAPGRVEG